MKPEIAVMSSTPGPYYLGFWPIVARCWAAMGIEPLLLYLPNDGQLIPPAPGRVVRLGGVPGVPSYLQALWARYWFMRHLQPYTCILSDIDMLPLNKWYFTEQFANVPDRMYVHTTGDEFRLPSCYHVAKGSTFADVLALPASFEASLKQVMDAYKAQGLAPKPTEYWGADESYATKMLGECPDRLIQLWREGGTRIDRADWRYDEKLLAQRFYIDAHLPRPFQDHEESITELVEMALG